MKVLNVLLVLVFIFLNSSSIDASGRDLNNDTLEKVISNKHISKKLFKKRPDSGMIYMISPRMPLSLVNYYQAEEIAKEKRLPLTVVVDSQALNGETEERKKYWTNMFNINYKQSWYWNKSSKLKNFSSDIHYPNLIIYREGQFIGQIFGAKNIDAYRSFVTNTLEHTPQERSKNLAIEISKQQGEWEEVIERKIPGFALYFFKPFIYKNQTWVAYITSPYRVPDKVTKAIIGTDAEDPAVVFIGKTRVLNLETGESFEGVGKIDPIPTPDGKYLTIPHWSGSFQWGKSLIKSGFTDLKFYNLPEIIEKGRLEAESPEPSFITNTVPGTYQSIGQRTEGGETIYRVVAESIYGFIPTKKRSRFYFNEFKEDNGILKPLSNEIRAFCPGSNFGLPYLSKTGKLFGNLDPHTRVAKISSVTSSGKCKVIDTLEIPTGKLDFSYDDSLVTFHLSWFNSEELGEEFLSTPKLRHAMDVMLYEIEPDKNNKKITQLTNCQEDNANCYYPAFTSKGDIVYLKQYVGKNGKANQETYSFVLIKRK